MADLATHEQPTLESLTRDLLAIQQEARAAGQYEAAVAATLALAQIHGLIPEPRKNEREPLRANDGAA